MATVRIALHEVVGDLNELEDPRSTINRKHPFVSVVVIALMAVLAGASSPTTIAQLDEYKEEFLRILLDLPNGVPRKDVFRRVLALPRPDAFQACFRTWLESLGDKAAEASQVGRPVYAVDGKTARRSHDRKEARCYTHLPVPESLRKDSPWRSSAPLAWRSPLPRATAKRPWRNATTSAACP
jgi:hypothetical protein